MIHLIIQDSFSLILSWEGIIYLPVFLFGINTKYRDCKSLDSGNTRWRTNVREENKLPLCGASLFWAAGFVVFAHSFGAYSQLLQG